MNFGAEERNSINARIALTDDGGGAAELALQMIRSGCCALVIRGGCCYPTRI